LIDRNVDEVIEKYFETKDGFKAWRSGELIKKYISKGFGGFLNRLFR